MQNEVLMERRAEALAGRSPRKAGQDKVRQALDWVYRWGYSSATILDGLSGAKRRGLAARLVTQGLLKATNVEGGGLNGLPHRILTLTALGLSDVERWRETLLPYELDASRYRQNKVRHYMLAQKATAQRLAEGTLADFATEKELWEQSLAVEGYKQPAVLWRMKSGEKVGVEVELLAKFGPKLDMFVLACLNNLSTSENGAPARFDQVVVISDSPVILKRYKAAFEPGAAYSTWKKDERSRWAKAGAQKVPDWIKVKLYFRHIP